MPSSRISLTLTRHSFLLFIAFGRSSGLQPVFSQIYIYIYTCVFLCVCVFVCVCVCVCGYTYTE